MTTYYPKPDSDLFNSLQDFMDSVKFWEQFDAATPEERAAFEERVTRHIDSKAQVNKK